MAAKKGSTGRNRGRPRKEGAAPARRRATSAPAAPAAPPSAVDDLIAGATSAPRPDAAAALEALAAKVEQEPAPSTSAPRPALTGEIHDPNGARPGASASDVAQLSQQVGALAVVLFGLLALWRGDEWALDEDEAELFGDATADSYADEAAELMQQVKWLAPLSALLGITGRKFMAEQKRRAAEAAAAPRAPGTEPRA